LPARALALWRPKRARAPETVADLRATVSRLLLALPAPERPQEAPTDEMQKRLEEAEAHIAALTASQQPQEAPSAPPAGTDPPKAPRGFLARLLGR
jgi:hypothetical protein